MSDGLTVFASSLGFGLLPACPSYRQLNSKVTEEGVLCLMLVGTCKEGANKDAMPCPQTNK